MQITAHLEEAPMSRFTVTRLACVVAVAAAALASTAGAAVSRELPYRPTVRAHSLSASEAAYLKAVAAWRAANSVAPAQPQPLGGLAPCTKCE